MVEIIDFEPLNIDPFVLELINRQLIFGMTKGRDDLVRIYYFEPESGMNLDIFIDALRSEDTKRFNSSNWNSESHSGYYIINEQEIKCEVCTIQDSQEFAKIAEEYMKQFGTPKEDSSIIKVIKKRIPISFLRPKRKQSHSQ